MTLSELSPERRLRLRRLGALAIELAEIDREVAMLTASQDAHNVPAAAVLD